MSLGELLGGGSCKALYHLNGNTDDSSGLGNNGTATSITWEGGRLGSNCASFNGTTSYINIPDNASLDLTTVFISMWIYPTSTATTYYVLTKGYEASNLMNYCIRYLGGNQAFEIRSIGPGGRSHRSPTNSVPLNTWTKIEAYIYNGATIPKMWINGSEITPILEDGSQSTYIMTANTQPLRLGCTSNDAGFFPGKVDEVFIGNTLKTNTEIQKEYTYNKGFYALL